MASLCARDTPWKPSWKARSPAGEAAAEYKDRREKSIAERKAKVGVGTKRNAEGAYRAQRNEQAAAATSSSL